VFYELVNLSSGNRVGDYETDKEALSEVWAVLQRRGPRALDAIALIRQEDLSVTVGTLVAEGEDLVRLAKKLTLTRSEGA
jgi:hypothetical protein